MCCVCVGMCNHVGNHSYCAAHGGVEVPTWTTTGTVWPTATPREVEEPEPMARRLAQAMWETPDGHRYVWSPFGQHVYFLSYRWWKPTHHLARWRQRRFEQTLFGIGKAFAAFGERVDS